MIIPYQDDRLGTLIVPRPKVRAYVEGKTGFAPVSALVNPAAEFCLFDKWVAGWIDVDLGLEREFATITGETFQVRLGTVALRLEGEPKTWEATVAFAEKPLMYSVLGYNGFLQHCVTRFDGPAGQLEITW